MENIDDLLMMTSEEIDFESLSEGTLKELALCDDLFIATSALGELSGRNSAEAGPIALKILSESHGDRYLQACALETLFGTNREQATNFIKTQAEICDPYILNTILELMIEEQSYFKSSKTSSLVNVILNRLKRLDKNHPFPRIELEVKFKRLYD